MKPSSGATAVPEAPGKGPGRRLAVLHRVKAASPDDDLVRVFIADGQGLCGPAGGTHRAPRLKCAVA